MISIRRFSPYCVILIAVSFVALQKKTFKKCPWFMQGRAQENSWAQISRSFVSDQWIIDVINPQMCYIREQPLAATQTTGKTVVE